jgi:hypothetical protein
LRGRIASEIKSLIKNASRYPQKPARIDWKITLAPAFSGFRNSGGKGFLSLPGDRTEEFIPKTGRSNQKARKSKSTPIDPKSAR